MLTIALCNVVGSSSSKCRVTERLEYLLSC